MLHCWCGVLWWPLLFLFFLSCMLFWIKSYLWFNKIITPFPSWVREIGTTIIKTLFCVGTKKWRLSPWRQKSGKAYKNIRLIRGPFGGHGCPLAPIKHKFECDQLNLSIATTQLYNGVNMCATILLQVFIFYPPSQNYLKISIELESGNDFISFFYCMSQKSGIWTEACRLSTATIATV